MTRRHATFWREETSARSVDGCTPNGFVSLRATVDASEDLAESVVAYLVDPERLPPKKLGFLRESGIGTPATIRSSVGTETYRRLFRNWRAKRMPTPMTRSCGQRVVELWCLMLVAVVVSVSSCGGPPLPQPPEGIGPGARTPDAASRQYLNAIINRDLNAFARVVDVEKQKPARAFANELECHELWESVVAASSVIDFGHHGSVTFETADGEVFYRGVYQYPRTQPWYIIPKFESSDRTDARRTLTAPDQAC